MTESGAPESGAQSSGFSSLGKSVTEVVSSGVTRYAPQASGFSHGEDVSMQQNGIVQQNGIGIEPSRRTAGQRNGTASKSKTNTLLKKQSAADVFMCKLLCIPTDHPMVSEDQAHKMFSLSIALSGVRCLLSYVILPVLLPLLGLATGVGPVIGIPVGVLALIFDVKGIRRFWLSDHQWRWQMSVIYLLVIVMVVGLISVDVLHLAGIA